MKYLWLNMIQHVSVGIWSQLYKRFDNSDTYPKIMMSRKAGMRLRTNFAAESRAVTWPCGDRTVSKETYCVAYNLTGVMVITWLNFEETVGNCYFGQFCLKISDVFFLRSNIILTISQQWLVRLMWNKKEVHRLHVGYKIWPWPLTSLMNLTLDVSRSNFEIAVSQELLVWLIWTEKLVS